MTDVMAGIGAAVYVGTLADFEDMTAVGRVISISGPQLTAERAEITTLDSAGGYKEYTPAQKDGGEVQLEMYWKGTDVAQDMLRDAVELQSLVAIELRWPDSPQSKVGFLANVSTASWSTTANEGVKCSMTLKVSGQPDWTGFYADHRAVTFDGVNDYLEKVTNPGLADGQFFTVVAKYRKAAATTQRVFHCSSATSGQFSMYHTSAGVITVTAIAQSGSPATGNASVSSQSLLNSWYTVHACFNAAANVKKLFVNGAQVTLGIPTWTTPGSIDFSALTGMRIGEIFTDGQKLDGDLAFVWIRTGNTADSYIDDPSKFINLTDGSAVNLGPDGSYPGAVPQVFFGGRQDETQWNAGTNQGSGGNFTMVGDGVADV